MANVFTDTGDHNWGTSANWSAGVPDDTSDVTVAAGTTSLIINVAAECKSFVPTGTAGITISGAGELDVYGNLTLDAACTWTHTGILMFLTAACAINTAGKSLGTIASLRVTNSADLTLAANLNLVGASAKPLYIYNAGSSLITGNFQIDCGEFGDNATAGAVTLTLGTSTINCTNVSFGSATLTVTANTAAVNINVPVAITNNTYFGAKTWGGTITVSHGDGALTLIRDANTFGNLTITFTPVDYYASLHFSANQTITGTLTLTGNTPVAKGNIRGLIASWTWGEQGTQYTLTAAVVSMTGTIDFRDIKVAGVAAPVDLSAKNSGNLGGNSGITFRSPANYYLSCGANAIMQDYDNVYSTTDDGTPNGSDVFPLPQDTLVINDNSFTGTGQLFVFHSGGRNGNIDASALTKANNIALPRSAYGDLIYTGSGVTIPSGYDINGFIDGRLKNETGADTLDINVLPSAANTAFTVYSNGGTVRLITNNFSTSGVFTLTKGTFDLNGKVLTVGSISSSNANARTIQDSAGGGKIVLNGLTGTIFDTTTATNLTISNAPDIDIGDSNNTLTGDVTFIGSGKTYGDFKVTKHAGDFDCIVTGANTFGIITMETPDASYPYSHLQLPAGVTTTCTGFVSDGTSSYKNRLSSSSSAAHTLSDTTGTNTVTYTTISYSEATGGATWEARSSSVDGLNNTGWEFIAGGYGRVVLHPKWNTIRQRWNN